MSNLTTQGSAQQQIADELEARKNAKNQAPLPAPPVGKGQGSHQVPPGGPQPDLNSHHFYLEGDHFIEWVKHHIANELDNRAKARGRFWLTVSFTVIGLVISALSFWGFKEFSNLEQTLTGSINKAVETQLAGQLNAFKSESEELSNLVYRARSDVKLAMQTAEESEGQLAMMSIMFQLMLMSNDAERNPKHSVFESNHTVTIQKELERLLHIQNAMIQRQDFPISLAYVTRWMSENREQKAVQTIESQLRDLVIGQIDKLDATYSAAGQFFARHLARQIAASPSIGSDANRRAYQTFRRYADGLNRIKPRAGLMVYEILLADQQRPHNNDIAIPTPDEFARRYDVMSPDQQEFFNGELSYYYYMGQRNDVFADYGIGDQHLSKLARNTFSPRLIEVFKEGAETLHHEYWGKMLKPDTKDETLTLETPQPTG